MAIPSPTTTPRGPATASGRQRTSQEEVEGVEARSSRRMAEGGPATETQPRWVYQ